MTSPPSTLPQTTDVVLCITGSIAAYKSVELARLLLKQGRNVEVVMTASAEQFVGVQTLAGVTGSPIHRELFSPAGGEPHVKLAKRARALLIAPATADCIARLASGRADDLACATALCFEGPVFLAPAMHPNMWQHPATRANVEILRARGVNILGPAHGAVASGDEGWGRMLEPAQIADALSCMTTDLLGRRLVISAGPTLEDIDPVRFIGNRSSGKMGFALARRAAARGAAVCLVSGPVELPTPALVDRRDVRSALDMLGELRRALSLGADGLLMAAAVGDYRALRPSETKLQRGDATQLELVPNPDVVATLAAELGETRPSIMAFAVETGSDEQVIARARGKLERKRVDIVVANHAADAFGHDHNRAHLVTRDAHRSLPTMPKDQLADALLDWLVEHWSARNA